MDFSTLIFDFAAIVGAIYILFGLMLHLIEAWQSCAAVVVVSAPASKVVPVYHRPTQRNEPSPRLVVGSVGSA